MQIEDKISVVEAILFACGEPIDIERLAISSGVDEETLPKIIQLLKDRLENCSSSLTVLRLEKSYQLATREEFSDYIKIAMESKKTATLSPAAMEVLTIVAYNQPVTKSFIEHVRGVDSSSVVNTLVEKVLLEEAGRLDVPGRPISYRTTDNFLRCFKMNSLDELPPLPSKEEQISFDDVE